MDTSPQGEELKALMKDKAEKIAIIVLNYKNVSDTIACIESLKATKQLAFDIIVVDNASKDGSVEELKKRNYEDVILLEANQNNGYAIGNNLGLKYAYEGGYRGYLILNNDTLATDNMTNLLFSYLESRSDVAFVGPGICTYEDPSILESAGSLMNLNNGQIQRLHTGEKASAIEDLVIPCDYVGGACMALNADTIDTVGFIPDVYFLFFEENEWCQKAKKKGKKVICLGKAQVIHKGSATIKKFNGLLEYYTYRNLVLFIKRNGSFMNKLHFYPYILGFALKAGFTKENGWRFLRYVRDGLRNRDTFDRSGGV